jgi:hypothetical protein
MNMSKGRAMLALTLIVTGFGLMGADVAFAAEGARRPTGPP